MIVQLLHYWIQWIILHPVFYIEASKHMCQLYNILHNYCLICFMLNALHSCYHNSPGTKFLRKVSLFLITLYLVIFNYTLIVCVLLFSKNNE